MRVSDLGGQALEWSLSPRFIPPAPEAALTPPLTRSAPGSGPGLKLYGVRTEWPTSTELPEVMVGGVSGASGVGAGTAAMSHLSRHLQGRN